MNLKQLCILCLKSPVERAGAVQLVPAKGETPVDCTLCADCYPQLTARDRRTYLHVAPTIQSNFDDLMRVNK